MRRFLTLTTLWVLVATAGASAQTPVLGYTYDPNHAAGQSTAATNASYVMWYVGALVLGNSALPTAGASAAWTLDSSSNTVTQSSADNLHLTGSGVYTASDWVQSTTAGHGSWFCMHPPNTDNGVVPHICVADDASTGPTGSIYNVDIWVGYGSLSGGSTTALPTFPANQSHEYANLQISDNSGGAWYVNGALSSAGTFQVVTAKASSLTLSFSMAMFETGTNPSYDPYHDVFFAGYATSYGPYYPANFGQNLYGIQYDGTALRQMLVGMTTYYPYGVGSCGGLAYTVYTSFCGHSTTTYSNLANPTGYVSYGGTAATTTKETTPNPDGNYNFWAVSVATSNVSGGGQLMPKGALVDVYFINNALPLGALVPGGNAQASYGIVGTGGGASGADPYVGISPGVLIPVSQPYFW